VGTAPITAGVVADSAAAGATNFAKRNDQFVD
jgi:hypothetical protein